MTESSFFNYFLSLARARLSFVMTNGSVDRDSHHQQQQNGSMGTNDLSDHGDNFEFAFNSSNFSDRTLRIEIVAGAAESRLDGDDSDHHRKWRKEIKSDGGYEPLPGSDSVRVKSVFINSAILAAKSPFFYKLFSNDMRESNQQNATLRINASEEAAVMELLSFMYSRKLSISSPPLVLDVLMAADKFEVASCMRYCSKLLRSMPMNTEFALLYLELPSNVAMASPVQLLTDAAKEFIADKYCDISKSENELMNLPLAGIEAILESDDLEVASEDAVYEFIIKWAEAQYPSLSERRKIIQACVDRLVRFPFMSCSKLREVLVSPDLDREFACKAVLDAVFFKAEPPSDEQALVCEDHHMVNSSRFVRRGWTGYPVKSVEIALPEPHCVVFFDVEKDECDDLMPKGELCSEKFCLGGNWFQLSVKCDTDHPRPGLRQSRSGVFLVMPEEEKRLKVDYELSVRTLPTRDFESQFKGQFAFSKAKGSEQVDLYGTPWIDFMRDDGQYFINGVLHLRAELTLKQP